MEHRSARGRRSPFSWRVRQRDKPATRTFDVISETQRPIMFAMPGSTYGLNALSQPSGISLSADPLFFETGRTGVVAACLATIVVRSVGEARCKMFPLRSIMVTTASLELVISTEKGMSAPRTLNARTTRSVLFVLSTTGAAAFSPVPSNVLTPPQAHEAMAQRHAERVR
jgi:hypothetical protein